MTLDELLQLLKKVLLTPQVIGVTVAIVLYIYLITYIVDYHKRTAAPKGKKSKKVARPAPVAASSGDNAASDDERPSSKGRKGRAIASDDAADD
jgi:hypothetical protein